MMLNSNPSPWRRSRVLYVIPVAALALSAFATPEFKNASVLIEETVQTQDKITESSANMQAEGEKNVAQTDTLLQGLVGRIPGLETADDGTVYLNGKKVRKIVVNGQEMISTVTAMDEDKETAYKTVDSPAQFTGGQEAFGRWVSENMVYPPKAQEQGIQGQVAVQFIVEKDGSITEVEGIRSPDQLLTDEAVRLVKAMPKWIPAKNKGEIVRSVFVVTLAFRLS